MHDPELIKEEKRKVIEAEIRVKVRRRLQQHDPPVCFCLALNEHFVWSEQRV